MEVYEFEPQFKCLLVNDCDMQLLMQTTIMKQCGFGVDQATNGFEAFQKVMKTIDG
jgi:PleD family two-component response regulator